VKIVPITETIRSLETVRDRKDEKSRQEKQQQKEQNDKDQPPFEVTDQKVADAMKAFQSDAQAKEAGISASLMGQGPGLKVVLLDGSGVVIRQFTGEEFVKIREAANGGKSPGKILDRKL